MTFCRTGNMPISSAAHLLCRVRTLPPAPRMSVPPTRHPPCSVLPMRWSVTQRFSCCPSGAAGVWWVLSRPGGPVWRPDHHDVVTGLRELPPDAIDDPMRHAVGADECRSFLVKDGNGAGRSPFTLIVRDVGGKFTVDARVQSARLY